MQRSEIHNTDRTDTRFGVTLPLVQIDEASPSDAPPEPEIVHWQGVAYYVVRDEQGAYLTRQVHGADDGGNIHRTRTAPASTRGVAKHRMGSRLRLVGGEPTAWVQLRTALERRLAQSA